MSTYRIKQTKRDNRYGYEHTAEPWIERADDANRKIVIESEAQSRQVRNWVKAGNTGGFANCVTSIAECGVRYNGSGEQSGPRILIDYDEAHANAQRIVACVNACKGIENPAEVIQSLVSSLREVTLSYSWCLRNGCKPSPEGPTLAQARAVLASVEGVRSRPTRSRSGGDRL